MAQTVAVTFYNFLQLNIIEMNSIAYLAFGWLAFTLWSSVSLSNVMKSTLCLAAYWMNDDCLQGLAYMIFDGGTIKSKTSCISPCWKNTMTTCYQITHTIKSTHVIKALHILFDKSQGHKNLLTFTMFNRRSVYDITLFQR